MNQKQFVYHLVPRQLQGTILYPLNQLHKRMPDIAAIYRKKYEGREILLERRLPLIDCLWNDVLMFSPVHPEKIHQTFLAEGYTVKPTQWFEVPLERLDPQQTIVYECRLRAFGDHTVDSNEFSMLSDHDFEALTVLPDTLLEHINVSRNEGRSPFRFMGIPHIMYQGSLEIEGIEVVEF